MKKDYITHNIIIIVIKYLLGNRMICVVVVEVFKGVVICLFVACDYPDLNSTNIRLEEVR